MKLKRCVFAAFSVAMIFFISGCKTREVSDYELYRMEPDEMAILFIDYWNNSDYESMKRIVSNPELFGHGYFNWMANYEIASCSRVESRDDAEDDRMYMTYEMCDYAHVKMLGNIKTYRSKETGIDDGEYEMDLYLCKYQNNSPWLVILDNLVK